MTEIPNGSYAVMAQRVEPPDSLDYFPTPPWATRALFEHVLPDVIGDSAWEPAAGEGHMAEVLAEYLRPVLASDVFDYGKGHVVGSFIGDGPDVLATRKVDWIITNPPFRLAVEFAERALMQATIGVALLVRSVWSESAERYKRLFAEKPPAIIAQFAERVPMVKGRWNPNATTATSYAWFVWYDHGSRSTDFMWIPPGCRKQLTKPSDLARFAA